MKKIMLLAMIVACILAGAIGGSARTANGLPYDRSFSSALRQSPSPQPVQTQIRIPLQWVRKNVSIPANAIAGGQENGGTLYVCRAPHNGGLHPGKIVDGNCNIGWGGEEQVIRDYEVLIGDGIWGKPRADYAGSFAAGQENGEALYLCRAPFNGGVHPGKVVAGNCNIGWGGKEETIGRFEVFYAALRSIHSNNSVKFHLKNGATASLKIFWVDYNGALKDWGNLRLGESITLDTYETHPWVFMQSGRRLGQFTANSDKVQFFGIGVKPITAPIQAGPLWNQQDAENKCHPICAAQSGVWTSAWRTTVQGQRSECDCKGFLTSQ
jgi:hypothetical protein